MCARKIVSVYVEGGEEERWEGRGRDDVGFYHVLGPGCKPSSPEQGAVRENYILGFSCAKWTHDIGLGLYKL